jgi:hypothetical protein
VDIELILEKLNIPIEEQWNGKIRMPCPIHNGDNPTSLSIIADTGYWSCWSHKCHEKHGSDLVGLVSGIKDIPRKKAQEWLKKAGFEKEERDLPYFKLGKRKVCKDYFKPFPLKLADKNGYSSKYFSKMGFTDETIQKFRIKDGNNKCPVALRERSYAYVIDGDNVVGAIARSWWNECNICNEFHDPKKPCPSDNNSNSPKWLIYGFYSGQILYNLNNIKSKTVVVFEGAKEVFLLDQLGIPNGVCCFGSTLKKDQVKLLVRAGIENIVMGFDNDDAGRDGYRKVLTDYRNLFNISTIMDLYKGYTDLYDARNDNEVMRLVKEKIICI